MQCSECCRNSHLYLPLHRVEVWKGTHFEPAWLWQNGVVIHLGHNGAPCPGDELWKWPVPADSEYDTDSEPDSDLASEPDSEWELVSESDDNEVRDNPAASTSGPRAPSPHPFPVVFPESADPRKANLGYPVLVIVDVTGIHEMPVHFCTCNPSPVTNDNQLFDCGLFPATFKRVQTAFTFRVLDDFRMDNLESKTSAYHYYNKLRRVTCPAFPSSVKVSWSSNLFAK